MIEVNATINLPDIVRAAVHRRIQVLREKLATAEIDNSIAHRETEGYGEKLSEFLTGTSIDSAVPGSIDALLVGLNEVGVDFYVEWVWHTDDVPGDIPELITVHLDAPGNYAGQRKTGLMKNTEIVVKLGEVSDAAAAMFGEHLALTRKAEALAAVVARLRQDLARPDMAREMEGEMLASMIEAQAPEISARIEELAMGRRLIGVTAS